MVQVYLEHDDEAPGSFELLRMAEAGELGYGEDEVGALAAWAVEIERKHFDRVRNSSLRLAEEGRAATRTGTRRQADAGPAAHNGSPSSATVPAPCGTRASKPNARESAAASRTRRDQRETLRRRAPRAKPPRVSVKAWTRSRLRHSFQPSLLVAARPIPLEAPVNTAVHRARSRPTPWACPCRSHGNRLCAITVCG
jgi:hypothetical protein